MSPAPSDPAPISSREVIHVLAPGATGQGAVLACAQTVRTPDIRGRVWLLGSDRDAATVRELGVRIDRRFPGVTIAATPARRRDVRRRLGASGWMRDLAACRPPDAVVCAWGVPAAQVWEALGGPRADIVVDADGTATETHTLWDQFGQAPLVVCGDASADTWRAGGPFDVRVASMTFLDQCPPAPASDAAWARAVRASMDLRAEAKVIGLLADPPWHADARWFAFVLGLLYAAGLEVGGLLPAGSTSARRGARFVMDHSRRWALHQWEGTLIEMCRACDALIAPPSPVSALAPLDAAAPTPPAGAAMLSAAARTGVPLIVPRCPMTQELAAVVPLTLAATASQGEYSARVLESLTARPPGSPAPAPAPASRAEPFALTVATVIREVAEMLPATPVINV